MNQKTYKFQFDLVTFFASKDLFQKERRIVDDSSFFDSLSLSVIEYLLSEVFKAMRSCQLSNCLL